MTIYRMTLWLAVTLAPLCLHAQWTKAMEQRGFVPGASYDGGGLDSVNMANGNLVLQIPITSLPGGVKGSGYDLNLFHNSGRWNVTYAYLEDPAAPGNPPIRAERLQDLGSGMSIGGVYGLWEEARPSSQSVGNCTHPQGTVLPTAVNPQEAVFGYRMRFIFPDGSQHVLYLANAADFGSFWTSANKVEDQVEGGGWYPYSARGQAAPCVHLVTNAPLSASGPFHYYTRDGTFVRLRATPNGSGGVDWVAHFPDGRIVTSNATYTIEYPGGAGGPSNTIHFDNFCYTNSNDDPESPCVVESSATKPCPFASCPGTRIYDDFGRWIRIGYGSSEGSQWVEQPGHNGTNLLWQIERATLDVTTAYPCSDVVNGVFLEQTGCAVESHSIVTTEIKLPGFTTPLSYHFEYTSATGNIAKVTLPYGATIDYEFNGYVKLEHLTDPWVLASKTLRRKDPETNNWLPPETSTYDIAPDYTGAGGCSDVTNPDGGTVEHCFYPPWGAFGMVGGRTYRIQQPDGSRLEQVWAFNPPGGTFASDANPYLKTEIRMAAGGSPNKAAITDYKVDTNGNVRQVDEYDWVDYASVDHESGNIDPPKDVPCNPVAGPVELLCNLIPLRSTFTTYWADATLTAFPPAASPAGTAYDYWKWASPRLLTAPKTNSVSQGSTTLSFNTFDYSGDDAFSTGNVTQEWRWDNTKTFSLPLDPSNAIGFQRTYSGNGSLVTETDPNGVTTRYVYASGSHPYPTQIIESDGVVPRTWDLNWNANSGRRNSETDPNGVTISAGYDTRGRVLSTDQPGLRKTSTSYDDSARTATVTADREAYNDQSLSTTTTADDLGRVWKTHDNVLGIDTIQFSRVVSGESYELVSNPHSNPAETTMGWTMTSRDTLGRVKRVETFEGQGKPYYWPGGTNWASTGATITTYAGESQTVTDPAGAFRTLTNDGLGRLKQVTEPGSLLTTYTYDALDKLLGVTQGAQTRTFVYNSLGHLISAANPENGAIAYEYDKNGNLVKRTDARGVITCFGVLSGANCDSSNFQGYNRFNQPIRKQYSDGTPNVTYTYGGCSNGVGRLCQVANSESSTTYSYDGLGRVTSNAQTTGTAYPQFTYQWAPSGLKRTTYPSGRIVAYAFDNGGRVNRVANGELASPNSYVNNILYTSHGAPKSMTVGSLVETREYNPRLQPTQIQVGALMTLGFGYGTSNNNGNVLSQTIQRGSTTKQQTYQYDLLNRLTLTNQDSAMLEDYDYDRYGNRWLVNQGTQTGLPGITAQTPRDQTWYGATVNNRIQHTTQPWGYDNAGNVTAIGGMSRTFEYDAENRMKKATIDGNVTTYVYDGEGRRVKKVAGAVTTTYVYDAMGQLAAEYGGAAPPSDEAGTRYFFSDHLGSTRLIVNATGSEKKELDYLPFGEQFDTFYPNTALAGASAVKFTSKERDAETGLDFFLARYYSSAQGRFTSPDEWAGGIVDAYSGGQVGAPGPLPYADISDPQTINKYAYVRNNPLRYTDPDGHCGAWCASAIEFFESPAGQQVGRKVTQWLSAGTGAAAGAYIATREGVKRFASEFIAYTVEHGAKSAARQDMDDLSGRTAREQAEESGSYTNTHESGKTYSGKGGKERSQASGRRVEQQTGDKHTATDWQPAKSGREAFKDESRRIDATGGAKSPNNYNERESPGKKYRKEDGEP